MSVQTMGPALDAGAAHRPARMPYRGERVIVAATAPIIASALWEVAYQLAPRLGDEAWHEAVLGDSSYAWAPLAMALAGVGAAVVGLAIASAGGRVSTSLVAGAFTVGWALLLTGETGFRAIALVPIGLGVGVVWLAIVAGDRARALGLCGLVTLVVAGLVLVDYVLAGLGTIGAGDGFPDSAVMIGLLLGGAALTLVPVAWMWWRVATERRRAAAT